MNYFELLNIPPAYDIDLAALEQAYFVAQRQFHPDRFIGKPEAERHAAMQKSVDCNQAYNTLKDPLKRAQYLLKLQDVLVGTDNDTVKPSHELLMEVMQWREEGGVDVALQQASIRRIAEYYNNKDWHAMAEETLRLGYIVKTLQTAHTDPIAL